MKQLERKVTIYGDQQAVSSVWRVPDGYDNGKAVIIAHGAGNDMHNDFITAMHERWSNAGVMAVKFNFLYMEHGRKLPDKADVLMDTWQAVVDAVTQDPELSPRSLFLSGKSLGGRMASMLAAGQTLPEGLIFLGYPLHPAGKPEKLRIDHLGKVQCPMLFIQGTRDALCELSILEKVLKDLGDAKNELFLVEGGDHSFKVPKKLGRAPSEVHDEIAARGLDFIKACSG